MIWKINHVSATFAFASPVVLDLIPCATAQVPPQARKRVFANVNRSMNLALALIRRLYPRLPMRIGAVGPYQEALARLRGERQPDLAVRWLNRLWIGRPMMEECLGRGSSSIF